MSYHSLDMSPEEIAAILKKEENQKYKRHKLTITKINNRTAFVKAIDHIFGILSLSEKVKIADNMPYINESMMATEEYVEATLSPHCEFNYELIRDKYSTPWEDPEYIAAEKWYKNLSSEDQKKLTF